MPNAFLGTSGLRGINSIDAGSIRLVMGDIKRRIERIIETDPVIKKGLQRGIINSRALTRFIQDSEGIDSTPDAILGIIRRYPLSGREPSVLNEVLSECELSLRNKVAGFEVEYHPDRMNRIPQLVNNNGTGTENTKLIVGSGFVRVISDQKAVENFLEKLQPGEVVRYSTHLAEISLHVPPRSDTRGLAAKITMELVLNDIDLWGITFFYWHHAEGETSHHSQPISGEGLRELVLFVAEADGPRALEALQLMLRENDSNSKQKALWFSRTPRQGRFISPGESFHKMRAAPTS